MNIADLKVEDTAGHPDTGPYSADPVVAASEMNAINRTVNKTTMIASEVYNAIDGTEWLALTATQQEEIWNIVHLGDINPFGLEATRFTAIFGGGSTTIAALAALRKTDVSRAVEIGLGFIKPGNIMEARI